MVPSLFSLSLFLDILVNRLDHLFACRTVSALLKPTSLLAYSFKGWILPWWEVVSSISSVKAWSIEVSWKDVSSFCSDNFISGFSDWENAF